MCRERKDYLTAWPIVNAVFGSGRGRNSRQYVLKEMNTAVHYGNMICKYYCTLMIC